MSEESLLEKLEYLLALDSENEVLEFKEAKNNYDFNKIGKYFSALANEANLKPQKYGWLIFGVKDKNHSIIGTNYRMDISSLHNLKEEIGNKTTDKTTFIEIYQLKKDGKRIVMFQIPSAPRGIPIAFDGHYYARNNESLQPLNIEKLERIRNQSTLLDWSKQICKDATIKDLDLEAIKIAREKFTQKNKDQISEEDIRNWDDITFLNKAKITIQGEITNTAILLLGKSESEHFLSPAVSKISWILKDRDGIEVDYQHFSCPLILSIEKIYNKIRNLKYRYIKDGTLFPDEVDKYEPYIIRESLNNCIAHQDYTLAGKINIVENEDSLVFSNMGSFIPETIDKVIKSDAPGEYYRNRFLADAMVNLKMIDTIGSGIKKMFKLQKDKLFPLPEYDIQNNKVSLTIIGKVLDINYAKKLTQSKNELILEDIILLDKVQKKKRLTEEQIKYLRDKKFIEGRKPNYYIAYSVAEGTELVGDYILHKRSIEEQRTKILKLIEGYSSKGISKKEIVEFVKKNKILEQNLNDKQVSNRVINLLSDLRDDGKIISKGTGNKWRWYKKK